jgi:MoaA/NifB/PqqE/SkfB family radical SAM enzyme
MLSPEVIKAYNAVRTTPDKSLLCHAPFTNLNFEQNGNVTACCYNRTHVLGSYPNNSIMDIWLGKKADELREYIKNNDLGGGCSLCAYQLTSGNYHNSRAKAYDYVAENKLVQYAKKAQGLITRGKFMQMPTCMEFEISNTCNLECVMCNGYFSSSIRKNREHKSAMHNPYDDNFVEQLKPFIPHLLDARFLGGEPFLIDQYYKIWDTFVEVNPNVRVHITTNATVLNQRVKTLLDKLNCHIVISMDSIVKETYESIRLNAKYDKVWENFNYFYEYTRRKGTRMNFAVCPITLNWHEMPDLVRFCNDKDIILFFNTVVMPQAYSLEYWPASELAKVVALYDGANLPDTTYREQYNKQMFLDMASQIRAWYELALKAESQQEEQENLTSNTIEQAIADGTILPEHNTTLTKEVLYEMLFYANGFPYADDEDGREAQLIATTRLFTNLAKIANQNDFNQYLTALFTTYRYLPMLNKYLVYSNGHESKLDELISTAQSIGNAQWIVTDMNHAEPMKVLAHMNAHSAKELIAGMHQQYF